MSSGSILGSMSSLVVGVLEKFARQFGLKIPKVGRFGGGTSDDEGREKTEVRMIVEVREMSFQFWDGREKEEEM